MATRKTKQQIIAERAISARGLENYKKTRPSKQQIAKIRKTEDNIATANQKIADRITARNRANAAKPTAPALRATRRGTPVAMPTKPGNIATGSKKTARPLPTGKPTKKPMTEAQRQADALDKLMKKRLAEAKKTGVYPNYRTN
jgi:hypothetical protein